MHEVGLSTDVLAAVLARASGRRVLGAGIRVAASHRVSVEALQQGFEHVSAGTDAEGARLEVEVVPARLHCRDCGTTSQVDDAMVACPACHSIDVDVTVGDELVLTWVRYPEWPE